MTRDDLELRLQRWSADHEDLSPFLQRFLAVDLAIAGRWQLFAFFDGAQLDITANGDAPDQWNVEFSTQGCLDQWQLTRTGSYRGGILRFSAAVVEYCPSMYDTLYTVRVCGHDYFVSQASLRHSLEDHYCDLRYRLQQFSFHRQRDESQISHQKEQPTLYQAAHSLNSDRNIPARFTSDALDYLWEIEFEREPRRASNATAKNRVRDLALKLMGPERRAVTKKICQAIESKRQASAQRDFNLGSQYVKQEQRLRDQLTALGYHDITRGEVQAAFAG